MRLTARQDGHEKTCRHWSTGLSHLGYGGHSRYRIVVIASTGLAIPHQLTSNSAPSRLNLEGEQVADHRVRKQTSRRSEPQTPVCPLQNPTIEEWLSPQDFGG